jgi:hypothetical protein
LPQRAYTRKGLVQGFSPVKRPSLAPETAADYLHAMTQSKQEVAERNARIRAEKLRENLARRKQQMRERAIESQAGNDASSGNAGEDTDENPDGNLLG